MRRPRPPCRALPRRAVLAVLRPGQSNRSRCSARAESYDLVAESPLLSSGTVVDQALNERFGCFIGVSLPDLNANGYAYESDVSQILRVYPAL
jgi:hypothetical protein